MVNLKCMVETNIYQYLKVKGQNYLDRIRERLSGIIFDDNTYEETTLSIIVIYEIWNKLSFDINIKFFKFLKGFSLSILSYHPSWSMNCRINSIGGMAPNSSFIGIFKSSMKTMNFFPMGGP